MACKGLVWKRFMSSKGKYCCFFCPSKDYSYKSLDDTCPTCGRTYGFPITSLPVQIHDYAIKRVLGRGFYGAAYIGEHGLVRRQYVIKISPIEFYPYFGKTPFEDEFQIHARLALNASHIIDIINAFPNETVEFSDNDRTRLACHVTVLDYVDGALLENYVSGKIRPTVAEVCQIAVDLLHIRSEFAANQLNHNDLHAENLIVEKLRPEGRRPEAICDSIKVKAIDLGSVADESKSNDQRYGDLRFIAAHVESHLDLLLRDPTTLDDRDFRIALSLQSILHGLISRGENTRIPNFDDLINQIREGYNRASHPWLPWSYPLTLRGFGDHYNAQTLESRNVPKLLVDPDGRWLVENSKSGTQIVTGMRGCGKTMLLRALDIHARAAQKDSESSAQLIERIKHDHFVGLFASAQRLLDLRQQSLYRLEHRLSRLFVNYSLAAARALLHIKYLSPSLIISTAHTKLASAVADFLGGADDLRQSVSVEDLERRLTNMLVLTVGNPDRFAVRAAPVEVFTHLAEQLRGCSEILASSTVVYLLDDVSTRYLDIDRIEELLSSATFPEPDLCLQVHL